MRKKLLLLEFLYIIIVGLKGGIKYERKRKNYK